MKKFLLVLLSMVTVVSLAVSVDSKKKKTAYEVKQVTNGGSIAGKALFAGATPPKDETLTLTSEQNLCGNTLPAQKYLINGKKEIKNVVVYIDDIESGKAIPKDKSLIDNVKCAFEPHVSVGYKGNEIDIRNSDPVFHNVHSYISGKTTYNLGLPDKGSVVTKEMKRDGVMEVKCDSHPWMLGYVFISEHPYAVATNETGDFSISDVPPGTYEVKAWHEGFGELSLGQVTVEAGKTAKINANYK
ncbi:MAG: hypothetical protein C4538_03315 [Nitrospiraceae bacterium]|nr:MAG: hypothetical protein C4538_03315 [Nitrospiraceae bacterium]